MTTVTCYPTPGKAKAEKMCALFAAGCGGEITRVGQPVLLPGPAFFYGWNQHTGPLIQQCQREGRDWYYADNAYYFGRNRYFRVTKNALMHDGSGHARPDRFRAFGIEPKPWRRDGGHIVLATQSELHFKIHQGMTRGQWTEQVLEQIAGLTDRPVVVCHKPVGKGQFANFEAALPGAWAVVSHSSSCMVGALLAGVPVFSLGRSMASSMGLDDLARIDEPYYPDNRREWLQNLAANQWTYEEIRSGRCWRDLQTQTMESAA